jgi:hypothetical protein
MPEQVNCPACGAPVDLPATSCPYCSAALVGGAESAPTIIASAPPPLPRFANSAEAMDEIKSLLRAGKKTEAVKVHREYFGTKLADAREAIEAIQSDLAFEPEPIGSVVTVSDESAAPKASYSPDGPVVSEPLFDEPQKPPAWRKWAIGCAVALVVFCCLCVALPAIVALVLAPAGL